ncbi:patatin-like phospholipase family protein [Mucilaginibacter gotjawali]|uniref:PNPLA domain-containing protein n=1 Tax=Mucilaginibacter gotjawali TaxID=1550579 RepID=A0A839SCK6_9SPHI|nr:patatin-like phospholipase family protein [Mucilaginibacter gotjawali]MBB3054419.1 hypothetical protein [Mucilaginibacter gotjawali]
MDIVTDLTAQAVANIGIIQNICKKELSVDERKSAQDLYLWQLNQKVLVIENECPESVAKSIQDVLWCSIGIEHTDTFKRCFLELAGDLLQWLQANHKHDAVRDKANVKAGLAKNGTLYCTPYQWRNIVREILFDDPSARLTLAQAMHYMPVQIILSLGGKDLSQAEQRLFQTWEIKETDGLLTPSDYKAYSKWWDRVYDGNEVKRSEFAKILLKDDTALLKQLNMEKVPLPFESLFNDELNEICRSRIDRMEDDPGAFEERLVTDIPEAPHIEDPLKRAAKMDLHGLALSGGGIRSATFSLGVLQKLAEDGKLPRFDYLSTVSGGGYIGTWLACWIKRSGSVSKVADRLNEKKSADPLGEEVRPIRWLRMFSNYLAPDASVMSADSWTMGITWLRNTLINQVLLLLLLCTALSVVTDLAFTWNYFTKIPNSYDWKVVAKWSVLIFVPAVWFVGAGMKTYDSAHDERNLFSFGRNRLLIIFLIIWTVLVTYVVSSWLYPQPFPIVFSNRLGLLWPAAVTGFVAMVSIAYIGLYRVCAQKPLEKKLVDAAIILSSAIAAGAAWLMLAGVWLLFDYLKKDWVFILGPPLVLECISTCVVIRMALMGKLFPDERREWWGRMGAITHRTMLMWILVTYSARELPDEFKLFCKQFNGFDIKTVLGVSWAGLVGSAVKMAYQSKENPGKPDTNTAAVKDIFVRVAPYIFMIGFIIIGANAFRGLAHLLPRFIHWIPAGNKYFRLTIALAAITYLFSWRVGVNEFSLHHFYRNRLVRAYLGATRKRTDRDKTANNFTGFDKNDDIKLSTFINTSGDGDYIGPYPIINSTLNATVVSELDRQDRKAESFIFSPLYSGFDFSPTRSAAYAKNKVYEYGYRPTAVYAYEKGPMIGTAMAISGAAVSPNMGYHSAPATAFLLTMFNVRLGWWMGNPRRSTYKYSDPTSGVAYLISDLIGNSDIDSRFVCLSDGGHFDNMGLYELVRRRCSSIMLVDAEEDPGNSFEGLANAIRRCRIDFGAEIVINTSQISTKNALGFNSAHAITDGTIFYPGDKTGHPSGKITYIKAGLVGTETTDVLEYHQKNNLFPQQPTSDQFFTEEQFESYRKLGYLSI